MADPRKVFPKAVVTTSEHGDDTLVFLTTDAFVRFVDERGIGRNESDWTGQTLYDCKHFCRVGDDRLVPEAQRQIDRLRTSLPDLAPSWQPEMAGEMVIVPEFVAGIPEHMRRKIPNETQSTPIKVVFDNTSSGGIDHNILTKRATSVLALLMRLIQERPVEFWIAGIYDCPRDVGIMIRLPTAPLNLALAAHMLTSQAIPRSLMYDIANRMGWGGGWNHNYRVGSPGFAERVPNVMRKFFACNDSDVMIPPAVFGYNGADERIYKQPLEWINDKLIECRITPTT